MTTYYFLRRWTAIINLQTQSPLWKILLVEVSNYMPPKLNLQHAVSVIDEFNQKQKVMLIYILA